MPTIPGAFQQDAFQNDAFQVEQQGPATTPAGGYETFYGIAFSGGGVLPHRRRKKRKPTREDLRQLIAMGLAAGKAKQVIADRDRRAWAERFGILGV